MSLLVTQTLYGAIKWFNDAPDTPTRDDPNKTWKEKAKDDLQDTLARTSKWEPSMAAQRGIDFENAIYNTVRANRGAKGSEIFREFLKLCKDGQFQVKTKTFLRVSGEEHCLYGKLDVLLPELIIDIKTTEKPWDRWSPSKYLDTLQHHMYCFTHKIKRFEYHIAIFNGEGIRPPSDHQIVPYVVKDFITEQEILVNAIYDIRDFMKQHPNYEELWREKYSLY